MKTHSVAWNGKIVDRSVSQSINQIRIKRYSFFILCPSDERKKK